MPWNFPKSSTKPKPVMVWLREIAVAALCIMVVAASAARGRQGLGGPLNPKP